MSQQTVADFLSDAEGAEVKQSYVSHVEHEKCNVSQERWQHLAAALGKSVEELYFLAIFRGTELTPEAAQKVEEMRELIQQLFKVE